MYLHKINLVKISLIRWEEAPDAPLIAQELLATDSCLGKMINFF